MRPRLKPFPALQGDQASAADPKAPPKDWVYDAPSIGFVLSGWFDYCVEGRSAFAAPGAVVLGNAGEQFSVRHHDTHGNRRAFAVLPPAKEANAAAPMQPAVRPSRYRRVICRWACSAALVNRDVSIF